MVTTEVRDPQTSRPRARADLDVNEVPDGLIIYDGVNDQVHYLNHTAAVVFCFCTGDLTEGDIAEEVRASFSLDELPATDTADCLTTFREQGLVD
jgi:hypothetical protein